MSWLEVEIQSISGEKSKIKYLNWGISAFAWTSAKFTPGSLSSNWTRICLPLSLDPHLGGHPRWYLGVLCNPIVLDKCYNFLPQLSFLEVKTFSFLSSDTPCKNLIFWFSFSAAVPVSPIWVKLNVLGRMLLLMQPNTPFACWTASSHWSQVFTFIYITF